MEGVVKEEIGIIKIKGPMRSIFYVHNAIKTELDMLVNLIEKLSLSDNFNEFEDRIIFLNDVVRVHAEGEEDVFYPVIDELRKDMSKAFSWDHVIDEKYFYAIRESITRIKSGGNQTDLESLKREIHALNATLSAHAQKEDDLLVPMIDKEIDFSRQGEIVGKIVAHIPPHLMERMFKWIVSIVSLEEKADFIGIIKKGAPPEKFDAMRGWVKEILSEKEWGELLKQMPELK